MARRKAGPGRLRHRIGHTLRERRLVDPGDRVAVAVSGGLDSVVLLDLLRVLQDWHRAELSVVTVDHGTRPGSASDADFVEELAGDLPFHRFDLALGDASEADCRAARYECFATLDVDRIAVAHHRDDQAETVLLNLLRGTGIRGLAGMAWRRGRIVRPLLDTPRSELEAWARHRRLSWRDDPSNEELRFLRNALRKRVLPLLEELRPGATKTLARSATLAAWDADYLERLVEDDPRCRPPFSEAFLAEGPPALVRRAIARTLEDPGHRAIDEAITAALLDARGNRDKES